MVVRVSMSSTKLEIYDAYRKAYQEIVGLVGRVKGQDALIEAADFNIDAKDLSIRLLKAQIEATYHKTPGRRVTLRHRTR